jgi:GH43 family beta-xylosidase
MRNGVPGHGNMIIRIIALLILLTGCTRAVQDKGGETMELFYTNPTAVNNIGDPFVLKAPDGHYYCYATSSKQGYLAWKSDDLINWESLGLVFNAFKAGNWASSDFWAPEVVYNGDTGKYYMYYTARHMELHSLRIGLAVSEKPEGPFIDALGEPLFDFGYAAIDAHVFCDTDGRRYLYYVRDCSDNKVNGLGESHIYGVELAADMRTLLGEPVLLTKPEQAWEKPAGPDRWNEGPFVVKHDGRYYLMYSGSPFWSKAYSVGYAVSGSPLGTFVKYEKNPVLLALPEWDFVSGSGHNSVTVSPDGTELFCVYHTHTNPAEGGGNRQMALDRMGFRRDGTLFVNGPSLYTVALPSGVSGAGVKNIAGSAKISVASGNGEARIDTAALTDGEYGFYKKFAEYDTVFPDAHTITVEWQSEADIYAILVYKGAGSGEKPFLCEIDFAGKKAKPYTAEFPDLSTGAAVFDFREGGKITAKSFTLRLSGLHDTDFRLSEIVVLGSNP